MITPPAPGPQDGYLKAAGPVQKLEVAYRAVLGEAFGESIRSLCGTKSWYENTLADDVVFRFWIFDNITAGSLPSWLFEPIRAGERRSLLAHLGLSPRDLDQGSHSELAADALRAVRLPLMFDHNPATDSETWEKTLREIDDGHDQKASVQCRGDGERFLKTILFFTCYTGAAETFLQVLRDPRGLRVPFSLQSHLEKEDNIALPGIMAALTADNSRLDFGFLVMALGQLDSALGRSQAGQVVGRVGVFTSEDQSAFEKLATSLQSYVHDKPTQLATRRFALRDATARVLASIRKMANSKSIPERGVVVEVGESLFGPFFRVQKGVLTQVLTSESQPSLRSPILYSADSNRDFSPCKWAPNMWTHGNV